ncbi:MAG: hypothetical protein A2X68_07270 [Ignavibacteria bacterium GWC2_56_12]|nr:MAG: hypothetical protein A2X68_07270 [Ignavibacteria bacterium GWC2_56_12]
MHRSVAAIMLLAAVLFHASALGQKRAPGLSLKTSEGVVVDLAKLKGKVVVVNFWATWCGPCRAEIPAFMEVYDRYRKQGVEIIGVSLDEGGWEDITPFVKRYQISYSVVLGNAKVSRTWGGIEAIPTTFIIDKNGNIVDQHVGMLSKDALTAKLKALL